MKRYKFEATINVDGTLRRAGEEVPEADIPSGCLASLIRLQQVSEVPVAPVPPAAPIVVPKIADAKPPVIQTAAPKTPAKNK